MNVVVGKGATSFEGQGKENENGNGEKEWIDLRCATHCHICLKNIFVPFFVFAIEFFN